MPPLCRHKSLPREHEDTPLNVIPEIAAAQEEFAAVRRDIHAHPELRYEEQRTSDLVTAQLTGWGIPVTRGLGKTGLVGTVKAGRSTRSVGLRADMDALPVTEQNDFPHRSQRPGTMHACGHDGHITMLLAAAHHLAHTRHFDGTVHLIFQPAEEGGAGARAMMDDGLFSRFPCDAVFALHNWPGLPPGSFAVNPGPIMASSNQFRVRVYGRGGHAAMPHNTQDPVFALLQIAQGLQGIITRNKKPVDSAVISITQLEAGRASNIIPDDAWLGGTVRTFSGAVLDLIESRVRQIAEGTAAAHGCRVEIEFERNYPHRQYGQGDGSRTSGDA